MECLSKIYTWLNEKIPTRYVIYGMIFLGTTNAYALRANLNVAIVAMVKPRPKPANSSSIVCSISESNQNSTVKEGEFDWSEADQENILGCFYWGYLLTCLLGGLLSERFSAKWVAGLGVFCTAFLTLFTPLAARTGLWSLIILRIFEGVGEGVTFPAFYALVARWSPPHERSMAVSWIHIGDAVGTIIASPISAALIEKPLDGGWPLVFYCFGSIGVFWFLCWTFLVYDSPEVHPRIRKEEKNVILKYLNGPNSTSSSGLYSGQVLRENSETPPIAAVRFCRFRGNFPWKQALTSSAFWALLVGHVGYKWGYFTLFTQLPTYMKSVLHFNSYESALLSAVPYVCRLVVSLCGSYLIDKAIEKEIWSITKWRKLAHTFGNGVPGLLFIAVPFLGCNKYAVLAIVSICGGLEGIATSGSLSNNVDIAPNHAGIIYGIINTPGTLTAILSPIVAGQLTDGNSTIDTWATVFYIAAGFHVVGNIIFVCFAKGKTQSWNSS